MSVGFARFSFPRARLIWLGACILISIAAFTVASSQIDMASWRAAMAEMSAATFISVGGLLFLGALLAALRLQLITADIGYHLSFRDALLALSLGQITAVMSVQFFGQIAGRSAVLTPRGVTMAANVVAATYEKLIALGIATLLAVAGAWFLFDRLMLDVEHGGGVFLKLVAGIVLAVIAGFVAGWAKGAKRAMRPLLTSRSVMAITRNIALTIAIQLLTVCAYVAAARSVAGHTRVEDLFAASAVVMFAAGLPISFSGWGIRELSAVLALSVVRIPAASALAISVTVGILALITMIVIAALALILPKAKSSLPTRSPLAKQAVYPERALAWMLPCAAATAVFFQIYIPANGGKLNVNLADPIAIMGGAFFLWRLIAEHHRPSWRLPQFYPHMIAATAVIIGSFINGWLDFGWTTWAYANRVVGWFVILCYLATGTLISHQAGINGLQTLARTFVGAMLGILFLEFSFIAAHAGGLAAPLTLWAFPIEGFSQNRNAFSFLILLAICCVQFFSLPTQRWILAILLAGLWFAGSRAVFGASISVLVLALLARRLSFSNLIIATFIACGISIAISVGPRVVAVALGQSGGAEVSNWNVLFSPETSNVERLKSIRDGLELFLAHPLFGAGLGAYMQAQIKQGLPLVIHSTPIWLLSEMGLIGLFVFVTPLARIFVREWSHIKTDPVSAMLVSMILGFAVVSSVHEMLYQRSLWLFLGAALATMARSKPAPAAQTRQKR